MADYGGTASEVGKRVSRSITSSTDPNNLDVDRWINIGEAKIHNALKVGGTPTPVTDEEGKEELKQLSLTYATGMYLRALARAGGDGGNDDGTEELAEFAAVLKDFRDNPALWSAAFGGGDAADTTAQLRSHVTHDVDGRTSSHTDFAPTFTKGEGGDQF